MAPPPSSRLIVVLGTQPEYLTGLRGPMIRAFLAEGHKVVAIGAEEIGHVRRDLESWGASYLVIPLRRAGLNPIPDARAIWALFTTLRRIKPDILFAYTLKPVLYGLPAAWMAGIKSRYAMIAGRGFAFLPGDELRRRIAHFLATWMYRFALRFASGVLFHNEDDRSLFLSQRLVGRSTRTIRIYGSGIDLDHYRPAPLPDAPPTFLMISRLLADKGVREYVEAAAIVKRLKPDARFLLVGPADPSPNGISPETLAAWRLNGPVDFLGSKRDVRPDLERCHAYVLPSYGEGLPRSVLEAMAMARPVITTDVAGCRDTVVDGTNGYLVPPRDPRALAAAMIAIIEGSGELTVMGSAGLERVRRLFDVRLVNASILNFMKL